MKTKSLYLSFSCIAVLLYFLAYPAYSYLKHGVELVPDIPFNAIVFIFFISSFVLLFFVKIKFKTDWLLKYFVFLVILGFLLSLLRLPSILSETNAFITYKAYYIYIVFVFYVPVISFLWVEYINDNVFFNLIFVRFLFVFFAFVLLSVIVLGVYLGYLNRGVITSIYQIPGNPQMYLLISNAVVVLGFWLISKHQHQHQHRHMIFFLFLIFLFFVLSRSSLFFYLATYLIMEIYSKRYRGFMFLVAVLISVFVFILMVFPSFISETAYRYTIIFLDGKKDLSYLGREQLYQDGVSLFYSNPVFGYYGAEIVRDKNTGGHIHNLISYFVSYGIVYSAMIFVVIFISLYRVFLYKRFFYTASGYFCVSYFVYCLLSAALTKGYTWPDFFISLFLLNIYFINRKNKSFLLFDK